MYRQELTILQYHHVGLPPTAVRMRGLYVSPQQLAWQLRCLARMGAEFVTFERMHAESRPSGKNRLRVMITFDDGTIGIHAHAFPVLRRMNALAVVYPVVGDLGRADVVWNESSDKTPITMLSPEQVREMARAEIEFGSHLYHHVNADRLADDDLDKELRGSKRILEDIVRRPVLSIAYPYGRFNDRIVEKAVAAGYRYGVTARRGTNIGRNQMRLCRIPVKGTRFHHRFYFLKLVLSLWLNHTRLKNH
jgi:peptidoglycan/xylan/chitin deacetylase (PgdA/CDA1 family)